MLKKMRQALWVDFKSSPIVYLMLLAAIFFLITTPFREPPLVEEPKEQYTIEQKIRNGVFLNSDALRVSFYVTRVIEHENSAIMSICIVQRQVPEGVFENCVDSDYMLGWFKNNEGYITREARWAYY